MLTFKQSFLLLIGIITVLALIAIATGLSPLYWPFPNTVKSNSSASISNAQMATVTTLQASSSSISANSTTAQ